MPQGEPGPLGSGVPVWKEEDARPGSTRPALRHLPISLGVAGTSFALSPISGTA